MYKHLPPVLWRLLLHHYKQRNQYQTIDLGERQDCTAIVHEVSQARLLNCFERTGSSMPLAGRGAHPVVGMSVAVKA